MSISLHSGVFQRCQMIRSHRIIGTGLHNSFGVVCRPSNSRPIVSAGRGLNSPRLAVSLSPEGNRGTGRASREVHAQSPSEHGPVLPDVSRQSETARAIASSVCSWLTSRGGVRSILMGSTEGPLSARVSLAAAFACTLGWPTISFIALTGIFHNYVFLVGFWAWFIAQFMKIFTYKARKGVWRLKAFVDSGGMPSSHSALCTGVTTAVGVLHGFTSSLFAVSLCFSLIVMYDAAGVRRHAGKQAEVLNIIIKDLWEGHPVSERQLQAVLRSPGVTDSFDDVDVEVDEVKRMLTLRPISSRHSDDSEKMEISKEAVEPEIGEDSLERNRYKLERLQQVNTIRTVDHQGEVKLKEVLGHTPIQVICGAALGIIVGLVLQPV
eukprot:CAMPEP_0117670202 /NCGR_PEP_ID=MMETSP0804-20121206/12603_1 /TAXON_ID=1074897 /ORGANISM="Tetraselmis astigmatica, Strain CCMP880" /LENGTH=379 /DNA_ID=CAMNT_0005478437 /DNA_START=54 /DNA_END=1193 /DNA_ORIENTATION=+